MLCLEPAKSVGGPSGQRLRGGIWAVFLSPSLCFWEIQEEIFESAWPGPKFDLYVFVSAQPMET